MNNDISEQLRKLYRKTSKHSNYQVLAPTLAKLISDDELQIQSRHEKARWAYISKHIEFYNKRVVDIGGNTGFFSFSALDAGARNVKYFEGNKDHAEFVSLAANLPKYKGFIEVYNKYLDLERQELDKPVDVILLLNVLHHIGDDYGEQKNNEKAVLLHIRDVLTHLVKKTSLLVFQLGFNWKGDIERPLFSLGTKTEMIDFIKDCVSEKWNLLKVGIAEENNNVVEYKELDKENVSRVDGLGEFLNRPIFILSSK